MIALETVGCDQCGSADYRVAYRVQDTNYGLPGRFTIVTCQSCGLTRLNPRPTAATIAAAYPADYHPFRATRAGNPQPAPLQVARAAALSKRTIGRALDIGCGSGLFLVALRTYGWDVRGIEPDGAAVAFARSQLGLDVIHGTLADHPSAAERYDLVTLWDVLEHVPSPRAVLQLIHDDLLRPGGTLAINVPNYASIERRLFGARWTALDAPRHLTHFTPATLARAVTAAGFQITHLATDAPVLTLASNVLRVGGDLVLRGGRAKLQSGNPPDPAKAESIPGRRQRAIRRRIGAIRRRIGAIRGRIGLITLVHNALRPLNAVANRLGRGATIQLTAIAPEHRHPAGAPADPHAHSR